MEDINKTLTLLNGYIDVINENEFLRDHERRFSELRGHVETKSNSLDHPLNDLSKRLYKTSDNTFFCIELFSYKFYFLAKAIVHAIETENPLSLVNNTRSLIEQMAVFIYCMNAGQQMLDNLNGQGSLPKIDQIINKYEKVLNRVYSGEGKNKADTKNHEAIHVNDALKSLSNEILDVENVYDYLCEFVHPNYGSNVLISSGEIGRGELKSKGNSSQVIKSIVKCTYTTFLFLNSKRFYHPTITWNIHHLVELCFQNGAKITNVFSEKKAIPAGDGKTKDTAYYFKNARTSQEVMKLTYKYLEDIGYKLNPNDRMNAGIENECIYDVWDTHIGKIWFKTPMYKGI
jgi:hypothetical protein